METATLVDLGPMLAAVVGPILALGFATMRHQHVSTVKTRDYVHELIEKSSRENRELIEKSSRENRELVMENRGLIIENREMIEKNHRELVGGLGEVRERLAHIEGFLWRLPPPPSGDDAEAA